MTRQLIPNRPPVAFADSCPDCAQRVTPRELEPDSAGWFAIYAHCDGVWTKGFDR